MKQATKAQIDAFRFHEMHGSLACWTSSKMIDDELKKMNSNTAKTRALKKNIKIRVNGFGWKDLQTPWSKNGKPLSIHTLTTHLKKVLREESKREIPNGPPSLLAGRKDLPTLGTKVPCLKMFDDKQSARKETFVTSAKEAQQERVDE